VVAMSDLIRTSSARSNSRIRALVELTGLFRRRAPTMRARNRSNQPSALPQGPMWPQSRVRRKGVTTIVMDQRQKRRSARRVLLRLAGAEPFSMMARTMRR